MLDVVAVLPLIVFKLAPHRPKRITHGDKRILMGMAFKMLTLRDELGSRRRYLDVDFIETPLVAMFLRSLDDHVTVNHVRTEFLQTLGQLANARFQSG
jgi:hypothetical protein